MFKLKQIHVIFSIISMNVIDEVESQLKTSNNGY